MLSLSLDTNSGIPLYEQIYTSLRDYIIAGTLQPSDKLPSTRSLSNSLGVSRNTIDTAYYQLQAEGYIDAAPKSGFYVCDVVLGGILPPTPPIPSGDVAAITASHTPPSNILTDSIQYDFSPFAIDISHFPRSVWKKLTKQCLDDNQDIFLAGNHVGDEDLRHAICHYVRLSREVQCTPDQIIIGAGVDYLLQMLCHIFTHLGSPHITMEDPCYRKAATIFQNNGITLHAGILDDKGLTVDSISTESQLVYVTPSHQYPLGIVMPLGRRKELLYWAYEQEHRYIIEDDHDSEFRYKGKPIPSLQGIDNRQRVIYIGTFSKAVAPAIRVGYLVLPPELLQLYHQLCGYYSCTVSRLEQAVLQHFLSDGYFEKHVNRMRKIYKAKHDLTLSCLEPWIQRHGFCLHGDNAGLHFVVDLPGCTLSEEQILQIALEHHIQLYGLQEHYIHPHTERSPSILLGYANLSEEDIKKGIRQLADLPLM